MSDLVDQGAAAADRALEDHGDEWLAKGVAQAREAIAERVQVLDQEQAERAAVGGEPPPLRQLERVGLEAAARGLDGVERRAPALVAFGRDRARALLIHVASGDEGNARRLALASGSTYRARRLASATSTAGTTAATEARARATEEVLDLGRELGMALLHALPFLLAAL